MEVYVHSNLQIVQGEVTVEVDDEDRIDYLISAFCTQKNIRHEKRYVLRNAVDDILPNVRKLSSCGVKNGDILYLGFKTPSSTEWPCGCNQWWLLAVIVLLIGAVGLITITLTMTEGDMLFDYGVVLDAGSSHTKLFVYRWEAGKINGTAVVHQIHTCRSQGGGISNYTHDPEGAGRSLVPCLMEAQNKVPVSSHSTTPLWLGATAGMRLLRESDNETCNKILDSVRGEMKKTPFSLPDPLSQARILDGWEEGVFSWITVNYLTGNFGQFTTLLTPSQLWRQSPATHGAMDMGGASTQMTFVAADDRNTTSLRLYGQDYHVYTHSYLCYGFNEAFRKYRAYLVKMNKDNSTAISDPCLLKGDKDTLTYADIFEVPCTMSLAPNHTSSNKTYEFAGSGDSTACLAAVGNMFNFTCKKQQPPCSFNGVYQPAIHGDYVAFAGFYYLVEQLTGMGTINISYSQFRAAANHSCENGTSYEVVGELRNNDLENIQSGVCFKSQYVFTLLTEGYGFNKDNWDKIHFQNTTSQSSTDLGWTLGLMLNASNAIPAELPTTSMSIGVFVLLVLLFIAFIILSVGFACHARKKRSEVIPHRRLSTYGTV